MALLASDIRVGQRTARRQNLMLIRILSMNGDFVVVHNGIVENYLELREELKAEGIEFRSETDSEVIVQLIERLSASGVPLEEATRQTVKQLRGAHGIVVMSKE